MDSVESKGKSVDEAIFNGLNKLGAGIDEVEIEIINEGGKGLFGIAKSAVVRLTKKAETPPMTIIETPDFETDAYEPAEQAPVEHVKTAPPKEIIVGDTLAEKFINGLIEHMGIDAKAGVTQNDGKSMKIDITGADTAVLIGRRGDTLDAIQYLTGLVENKGRENYIKVMIDAENYREKREATLEKLARRLANNVIKSGKSVTLEPMNPYERRILHATLQNNPKVETYSEGDEPYRRVVIRRRRRQS